MKSQNSKILRNKVKTYNKTEDQVNESDFFKRLNSIKIKENASNQTILFLFRRVASIQESLNEASIQ
jgi:hypothetical protein